ncbi:SCP2 sterol-binding domain-containing protein [Verrucosispora sp. WMMA2044]|uniref:SCP2 sterol-binding domain-containing protein n=1 Tax=Verrucosispora sp. WMMA2044 TaxID=3016419 RepID=UPI00248B09C7|nr:SCP2 sterol-binding domain-containing protein [Verrucosispora sp. WMMA2044]WBB50955.1 SCP2 sterol-binding domain-containing protein [Verrucosispora sp. WMMA2044]
MSEAVRDFFDGLTRGGGLMLRQVSGTVRFDLAYPDRVDHWLVSIDQGRITVSRDDVPDVDTVIRADAQLFLRMTRGEVKPLSAWLRNDFTADGEFRFVIMLERLFAPPPHARHPREVAAHRNHRALADPGQPSPHDAVPPTGEGEQR